MLIEIKREELRLTKLLLSYTASLMHHRLPQISDLAQMLNLDREHPAGLEFLFLSHLCLINLFEEGTFVDLSSLHTLLSMT